MKMATVISKRGTTFQIDIDACDQFGFKYGERVKVVASGEEAIVLGVAPLPEGPVSSLKDAGNIFLWACVDGQSKVCFFSNPAKDLKRM